MGYGLYRRFNNSDGFDLALEVKEAKKMDDAVSFLRKVNLLLILIGGFLVVSGIVSVIARSRNVAGKAFRVLFSFLAAAILVVLLGLSAVSFYALAKKDSGVVFDALEDAWIDFVKKAPEDVCKLENRHKCRGLENNDCKACPTGVGSACDAKALEKCAPCTKGSERFAGKGCWSKFDSKLRKFYIAIGAASAVLAAIAFMDICLLCKL